MTRVASVTAKALRLVVWPRRESQASVPAKWRDAAEEAAALRRRENHYRRIRDAVEASFWMNGGRYV
jgi:hypothetical protein